MKSFDRRGEVETESWHGEAEATADERLELPERYELGEELGRGGMAVVYAARDRQLDRRVALKVLQPHRRSSELQQRLVREAQTLAKLRHPAVVTVYDVTQHAGRVLVAMELVDGDTLRAWSEQRPFGERLAACIAAGRGLAAVHDAGLVHRDFKPDNVLVDRGGDVRVADFGLARLARVEAEDAPLVEAPQGTGVLRTLTHAGQLVGTLPYMAPELLRGEPADAASDQFAFAVTLVEVLGGARPFAGDTIEAYAGAGSPAIADAIPKWIRVIAARALAPEPAARFESMGALLDALGRDPVRRRRRIAIAAGATIAIAGGAVALVLALRPEALTCEVPAQLDVAWSPARAQAVSRAFDAVKADPITRDSALGALESYHRQLGEAHAVACRERAIEGPDLAAMRATCLERRTAELAAIADRLERVDARTATRAVPATQNLSGIDECGSIAVLGSRMPRKPAVLDEGRMIDFEIAKLKVENDLARYTEVLPVLEPLLERARKLEHPPTEGEVQLLLGGTLEALDKIPAAEQAFRRAVLLAQTGRDDALLARAAYQLGLNLVKLQHREAEGRPWVELAVATIERMPPSPDLEARVLFAFAITELAAQHVDDADRLATRAHQLCVQAKGPDALVCSAMMNTLGGVALDRRDLDLAYRRYDAARASTERTVGRDSSSLFPILANLASVAYARGDFARAAELRGDLVARATRVMGPKHFNVGNTQIQYGITLERLGKLPEAIAATATGAAVIEAARGPDFPRTYDAKIQLARQRVLAGELGAVAAVRGFASLAPAVEIERLETELEVARREHRLADARMHAERALAMAGEHKLVRHEAAARVALAYAVLLREAGDAGAVAAAKRAIERNEAVFAADSPPVREARAELARAESPARYQPRPRCHARGDSALRSRPRFAWIAAARALHERRAMRKSIGIGVVVSLFTACAAEVSVPDPVDEELARLEEELAKFPGELVVTRSADMPFSEELEERLATAGKVIHIYSNERVTAFVGTEQVDLPEGVPPTRTFRELGGDIVIARQDLLPGYLVQEEPEQLTGIAHASALPIGHGGQWPESTVAYTINANITGADRTAIVGAISTWNTSVDLAGTQLKVRFVPRYAGDGRPYVDFVKGGSGGCGSSQVGRHDHFFSNWFSHSINIDCFSEQTIHHEMGHTAGLWHEQQRCDRDSFVTTTAGGVNCDMRCGADGVDFGPYNYLSVMQYPDGVCGFARNPPLSTSHRGQPWQAGTAPRLDAGDVQGLNQSYVTRPGMPQIGPGRFLSFIPAYTTRAMAIPASSTANNVQAVLFDRFPGWLDQHFTLVNVGEGFVQIRPRHAPAMCLEVLNFQTGNGAAVGQFTCDGATVQHWIVAPNAGSPSTFDVINRFSGRALDVAGWGNFNGALFQQWDHTSGTNQRFSLSPAI